MSSKRRHQSHEEEPLTSSKYFRDNKDDNFTLVHQVKDDQSEIISQQEQKRNAQVFCGKTSPSDLHLYNKGGEKLLQSSSVIVTANISDSTYSFGASSLSSKLTAKDFNRSGLDLARHLLGKILVHEINGEILSGRIVETEAYLGEDDAACHSYGGKRTERTIPMYMKPGESSMIRKRSSQIKNPSTLKLHQLCNGPSKLCQALDITKSLLNAVDMTTSKEFYIIDDGYSIFEEIVCKRIGIEGYGEESAQKEYRFYIYGNNCVSKKDKHKEKHKMSLKA